MKLSNANNSKQIRDSICSKIELHLYLAIRNPFYNKLLTSVDELTRLHIRTAIGAAVYTQTHWQISQPLYFNSNSMIRFNKE